VITSLIPHHSAFTALIDDIRLPIFRPRLLVMTGGPGLLFAKVTD
jgi:hypothetical protein